MIIDNFYKIPLINNSKRPCIGIKWETSKTRDKIQENHGILTGQVNDIIVIDLDLYKDKSFNKSEFIKEFTNEFTNEFIKQFNTYTVRTCNNGFHLYFKYDPEIKQTVCAKHNIDIRSDGGYVLGNGSIINNKKYKIELNTSIKTIPSNLKKWLLDNLYSKKELCIQKITLKKLANKAGDESEYKYLYNDKLLKDIFDRLPKQYYTGSSYINNNERTWYDFTVFCKLFNAKTLWNTYSKKYGKTKYNKKENNRIWDNANVNKYNSFNKIFNEASIRPIKHYKYYMKYKELNKYKLDYNVIINKDKLGYDFLDKYKNKSVIIRSPMGTGKTSTFKFYVKKHNLKFISIVSRISLSLEHYNIFNIFGIDTAHYKHDFNDNDNLVITIDSLLKLLNHDFDIKNYVLFLDEFNSIINHLLTSTTLKERRVEIFEFLLHLMKNAHQYIAVDADISDISVKFAEYTKKTFILINNNYINNTNISAMELSSLNDLINRLKNEDKYIVCSDSKKNVIYLYEQLNGKENNIKLITSDTNEYIDLDLYEKILYTPKILYGIDSIIKRPVFCYYKTSIISPEHMLQQLGRTRNISKLYYYFETKLLHPCKYTSLEDCIFVNENIKKLKYNFSNNCYGIKKSTPQQYFQLYCIQNYKQDCFDSNSFLHFILLLKEKGFIVEDIYCKSNKRITNKEEIVDSYLNDNFDINNYNSKKIIHRFNINNEEDILKYKKIIIDSKELIKHNTICKYFFDSPEELNNELKLSNDLLINKIKSKNSKILFIKRFQKDIKLDTSTKYFNCISLDKKSASSYYKEYNLLFQNNKTKFDLTKKYDIMKLNVKLFRNIFNENIIISKYNNKKDNEYYKYSFNQKFIDNVNTFHRELYNIRKNKYTF